MKYNGQQSEAHFGIGVSGKKFYTCEGMSVKIPRVPNTTILFVLNQRFYLLQCFTGFSLRFF